MRCATPGCDGEPVTSRGHCAQCKLRRRAEGALRGAATRKRLGTARGGGEARYLPTPTDIEAAKRLIRAEKGELP